MGLPEHFGLPEWLKQAFGECRRLCVESHNRYESLVMLKPSGDNLRWACLVKRYPGLSSRYSMLLLLFDSGMITGQSLILWFLEKGRLKTSLDLTHLSSLIMFAESGGVIIVFAIIQPAPLLTRPSFVPSSWHQVYLWRLALDVPQQGRRLQQRSSCQIH